MAAEGGAPEVARFHHDEAGYERWLREHGAGFVFNHFGGSDPAFNVLHRSGCLHLRREKDAGRRTVIEKLCSDGLESLEAEADRVRGGADGWRACGTCLRAGSKGVRLAPRRATAAERQAPLAPHPSAGTFALWRLERELDCVEAEPLLASWEAKDHPAQRRMRAYLDALRRRLGPRLTDRAPCYLRIDVVRPASEDLLHHYDLENYLTPVAHELRAANLVLAIAEKRHPRSEQDRSRVSVGFAAPLPEPPTWSFVSARLTGSPQKTEWKHQLRNVLLEQGVGALGEGPVAMHLAWRAGARSWVPLWKPTGDALGPILGEPISGRPFHPADDRIVRLDLHWNLHGAPSNEVEVGVWSRCILPSPGSRTRPTENHARD